MAPPGLAEDIAAASDAGLECLSRLLAPHLKRLDASLHRYWKSAPGGGRVDSRQIRSLALIVPGAAARMILAGRQPADFYEQVAYNSRRLAKLNVAPGAVVDALREYERRAGQLLAGPAARGGQEVDSARQELHFRTLLAVHHAYYQVREAETQAFYGLVRAELDATGLDDLLRRFIVILTRAFHAQAGRLIPLSAPPPLVKPVLKRLARPRYIVRGDEQELILDRTLHGAYQSFWSIPYFSGVRLAGLIQFGFSRPYRWLPRELDLLRAFAERCLKAAERARLIEDLAASEEQIRGLAGHLMQAEDEERRRIGREIHDEAGQSMLCLRLQLEMLEKTVPPDLRSRLAEARAVTERIIDEVRRIIAALNPSAVEDLGLPAAIRHLSARFRKLYPFKLKLRLSGYRTPLPHGAESAIYRVVQECYQNIAKHAQASHVNLSLRATDKLVELNIEDDGVGFDVDSAVAQPKSFGLKGMRERVALLGGRLVIRSSPGKGAAIAMRLPIAGPSGSPGSGDEHQHGNSHLPHG
ncbi:MAG TPA: sensor histidine kinase [Bryobacteraceae bacterium]|nr:sensor histidine kinase [Bryobacteraceae bacterium]